ncbi:unnamed protein product [Adineta ricciae]|uniref:Uncharacterized protein n=1 Tax=Adineta ricciae TaxID=249248 RepID=A0A815CTP4_ADIRI|nr:unnamed protein product [Adineta ricciae]CAF1287984.1 unnamed protein product [Adineta ricciae]
MSEFLQRNERPATIDMIDVYGPFAANPRVRTVQLCNEQIAFEIMATPSNSDDFVIVFLNVNHIVSIETQLNVLFTFDGDYSYYEKFRDVDECVDFISSFKYEKVF